MFNYFRYWKTRRWLKQAVKKGWLNASKHALLPLTLYKYSRQYQHNHEWTEQMMNMRGAVYENSGKRVSNPLRKFFNYQEYGVENPKGDFYNIEQKLDGSAVTVFSYEYKGRVYPIVTTLGSFYSEQAVAAKVWLDKTYGFHWIQPNTTYMFEWLDPDNFTTIPYKGEAKLVLITAMRNGIEVAHSDVSEWEGERVKQLPYADIDTIKIADNEEGVVVVFPTRKGGQKDRMKIKGEEFLRIHRARWGLNQKRVWESMYQWEKSTTKEFLAGLDEESRTWYYATEHQLKQRYQQLVEDAKRYYHSALELGGDNPVLHEYMRTHVPDIHRGYVYLLLAGKGDEPYRGYTSLIKPKGNVRSNILTANADSDILGT